MPIITPRKRARTKTSQADQEVLLVHDQLNYLMGGRTYVHEHELTRDIILRLLYNTGIVKTVNTFTVGVTTLDGGSFDVKLDHSVNNTSGSLKTEIEKRQGVASYLQEIFVVEEGHEGAGGDGGCDLADKDIRLANDSYKIRGPCTVMLSIKVPVVWTWDTNSSLVGSGIFSLSGENNCIATKVNEDRNAKNCLMAGGDAVEQCTGKYSVSFKIIQGYAMLGVVKDGVSPNDCHCKGESENGWFMYTFEGGLCGNGKYDDDRAGVVEEGQVVTLQLDTDKQELTFLVDGKQHGPGHSNVNAAALRWAFACYKVGFSVEIVLDSTSRPGTS
jgi:hypothetical protein